MNCLICGKQTFETKEHTIILNKNKSCTGFMRETTIVNQANFKYPVHSKCLKIMNRKVLIAKLLFASPFILITLSFITKQDIFIYGIIAAFIMPFPLGILLLIKTDKMEDKLKYNIIEYYRRIKN